ncbi:hypothetical protein [Leptospira sp. GIMC2001]|uniref:hypothetical protein n=1 Tax=Leptospira sp. GIMC2001 TaxID=1513297 RepID=UPI00234A1013|nr:hypothetical protein [Leptospira sp. GIMC2001]WCL50695.1 hypothetical protein O4O04_07765 [Leptospira sp. GIMC2001]
MYTFEKETDVFRDPNLNSPKIFKIPIGTKINVRNISNFENWLYSEDNKGYILSNFTKLELHPQQKDSLILTKKYSDCLCNSSLFDLEITLKLNEGIALYDYKANIEYRTETGNSVGSYNIYNNRLYVEIPKYTVSFCGDSKICDYEEYPELLFNLQWNERSNGYLDDSQINFLDSREFFVNSQKCQIVPKYAEEDDDCHDYCTKTNTIERKFLFNGYFCNK